MLKVYEALSIGWSLTGNHVAATCGLAGDQRTIVGVEEAGRAELRIFDGLRDPVVAHDGLELVPGP